MEQFVQGQRLTASQLNSAFEKVGGPMNPSNDYQWTKTDYGNLQTTWDTFVQVQNQNPKTLDVGIGYSKIGSETVVEIDGKKPAALRRVFINVGPPRMNHLANTSISGIPSFGTSNNFPIIGIVGLQYYGAGRYIQGDSKYHFSIFDITSGYPSKGETPQQWEQKQKLWQDDVARGCDSRNWWYSGITLERADPRTEDEQRLRVGNDLVCFPMYLLFTPVEQGGFANTDLNRVIESRVLLCVMLQEDYWGLNHLAEFAQAQEFMTQLERMYGLPGLGITVAFAPNWGMYLTLAAYVVSDVNTQNAYFHQLTNQVKFDQDTGPWRIAGFTSNLFTENPIHPYILGTTWIDQNGTQRGFEKDRIILNVVNSDGTPVNPQDDDVYDMYLACGYNQNTMTSPVLSCVRNNDLTDLPDDGVSGLLSGLFNDQEYGLSSDMQKRLVWISRNDTHGVQYYDTCPDFRTGGGKINISAWDGHEIDTADNVSNLVLSSRSDSRVEWDLVDLSGKWRIDCGVYYV